MKAPGHRRLQRYAGLTPLGLGQVKPNPYREIAATLWENRDQVGYAWRILSQGCCDGCALGTRGLRDWTIDGIHLCSIRLKLLRLNTMGPLDPALLADPTALRGRPGRELRRLGRLPYPMIWRRGEPGYRRVSWDEAVEVCAGAIRRTAQDDPDRLFFYLTSRGMANEAYYAFNKAARFLGTNNIDNAARICHAPSTTALSKMIGYGATTVSYTDVLDTDLVVLIGSNVANNQPVFMKYLDLAKKRGARVAVVNPYREEGLVRYWVPSTWDSALFGTRILDEFFRVRVGGDAAFFSGALKHLVETRRVDQDFIQRSCSGFDELAGYLRGLSWESLERDSGAPAGEMRRFADLVAGVERSILIWSMGVTQHEHGEQNVAAIANLALALGRIGRPGCGLMPIRGHSGVQGGAEVGAVPTAYGMDRRVGDPEAMAALAQVWGFEPPGTPGLSATAAILAAHRGRLDLLYAAGGNFLETLPDPEFARQALDRIPVKIFQDIVLNPMMLLEPVEVSVILPGATRYETPGGVTQTTTERRIIFSPEVPGRRIGEALPEWRIPLRIAQRTFPERAHLLDFAGTAAVRAEIARAIPAYRGIETLKAPGDSIQWGGPLLGAGGRFNTSDGRARFLAPRWRSLDVPPGWFYVTTRRGSQFNSMVWDDHDPLTGAARDAVAISPADAARLGLRDGDPVVLRNDVGEFRGRARIADITPGNLAVHWPEGNALLPMGRFDPGCGEPDYNAVCRLVVPTPAAAGDRPLY